MREWLKWFFANSEMETLSRYRAAVENTDRWLAEFPDAVDALAHVKAWAEGQPGWGEKSNIVKVRDRMRARRDGK